LKLISRLGLITSGPLIFYLYSKEIMVWCPSIKYDRIYDDKDTK